MKILNVQWFNSWNKCIGIVTIDNGFEVKTYMNAVVGYNEERDIQDIINNGAKIYPFQLQAILDCYKNKE